MLTWKNLRGTVSLLALTLVLGTATGWAQFTSAIEGTVTDPSGAVVPNRALKNG